MGQEARLVVTGMKGRESLRIDLAEASASVADLGTIVPIASALILVNGIDPVAALSVAGGLFVASAFAYRVPVPVQPIKAAAAIAIATRASPEVIAAAGILIGAVLLALRATRLARWLVRVFPKPVIRGNQLGVGILLIVAAIGLARRGEGADGPALIVAGAIAVTLAAVPRRRGPLALAAVAGGVAWTLARGGAADLSPVPALPGLGLPSGADFAAALTLLVIPQLPLTLGNAIVGTSDLEREYYGERAHLVTAERLCLTSGAANVVAGALGGMPLCHGSSGATAYHRMGARTGGVNLVLGGSLVAAGVLLGDGAAGLLGLIPAPVLAALLAYAGIRHALLVADLRGSMLGVALAMGAVGGATRNLSWAMAVGVPAWFLLSRGPRTAGQIWRARPRLYSR